MHQVPAVQIGQGIQGWRQKVAHLVRSKGAARKNLGEILFRVLHHDEQEVVPPEPAAAGIEDPDQVRMRQRRKPPPVRELRLRQCRIGRHYLDCRLGDVLRLALGEEYHAVV